MAISYRAPRSDEAKALAALGAETFCDVFAHLYAPADLDQFLNEAYTPEAVQADMDNPLRHYQVAEEAGALVGYCKIGEGVSLDYDPGERQVVELKQLYIRASHYGSEVAHKLMAWAIDEAKARGADDMLLSVYSDNPRAQRFYEKYNFAHVADTIFMVGSHKDHEYIYIKHMK